MCVCAVYSKPAEVEACFTQQRCRVPTKMTGIVAALRMLCQPSTKLGGDVSLQTLTYCDDTIVYEAGVLIIIIIIIVIS